MVVSAASCVVDNAAISVVVSGTTCDASKAAKVADASVRASVVEVPTYEVLFESGEGEMSTQKHPVGRTQTARYFV